MGASRNNIDGFHFGETIDIVVFAKNRDGTVIDSPASQTMKMVISATVGGAPLLEFSAAPQVILQDAGTGNFLIRLFDSDYSSLSEATRYFYNIWTVDGSSVDLLQAHGEFYLRGAIPPA